MKLGVVTMLRNETDIIGAFLQHLDALCDYAVFMDHDSQDGTDRILADACASRPGWTLWHIDAAGYHQERYCRFAAEHLMRHTDTDFVLFLDADEFVAVEERVTLETTLASLTSPDGVGILVWRDLVPNRFDARAFQLDEPVWYAPESAPFGKVVVPRSFYQSHWHEAHLSPGNHGFFYTRERIVPYQIVGTLLHLPLRSHAQLSRKVLVGVLANLAQVGRKPEQSRHWFDILNRIADGVLSDDDLIGLAVNYGRPSGAQTPIACGALENLGFQLGQLGVTAGRDFGGARHPELIDLVRMMATALRNFQIEDVADTRLVLDGNRLSFATPERPASAEPLPALAAGT